MCNTSYIQKSLPLMKWRMISRQCLVQYLISYTRENDKLVNQSKEYLAYRIWFTQRSCFSSEHRSMLMNVLYEWVYTEEQLTLKHFTYQKACHLIINSSELYQHDQAPFRLPFMFLLGAVISRIIHSWLIILISHLFWGHAISCPLHYWLIMLICSWYW